LETTYVNIFLATYRSFSTASQVLGLLIDRYDSLHQVERYSLNFLPSKFVGINS
jgi:RasGEF N-terminal motif